MFIIIPVLPISLAKRPQCQECGSYGHHGTNTLENTTQGSLSGSNGYLNVCKFCYFSPRPELTI